MFESRIVSRHLLPLLKPDLWRIMRRAQRHSGVSRKRMQNLWRMMWEVVRDGVFGDYVELGVGRGGTALLLAGHRLVARQAARQVWLCDAFEDHAPCFARHDDVRRLLFEEAGHDSSAVHLVKGFFGPALRKRARRPVAFAHLDAGGREGIAGALDALWPDLGPGAWLVFDNYGADAGCRAAVDARLAAEGLEGALERFGHSQASVRIP